MIKKAQSEVGSGLAVSSANQYSRYFLKWVDFCNVLGNPCGPFHPKESILAAFLVEMAGSSGGVHVPKTCFEAINYYVSLQGKPLPYSLKLNSMMKGLEKRIGCVSVKRDPFTQNHVLSMLEMLEQQKDDLACLRLKVMIELMWMCAARFEEVANLRVGNIKAVADGLSLAFTKGKTNQNHKSLCTTIPKDPFMGKVDI